MAAIGALFVLFIFANGDSILTPLILLQVATEDTKEFILANRLFISKLIGSIPGPIIFGAITDNACILWKTNCAGEEENCLLYDNEAFSRNYVTAAALFKLANAAFFSLALLTRDLNVLILI